MYSQRGPTRMAPRDMKPILGYGDYPYESYSAPYWGPAITFGIGFAVGPWLNYDCDWPRRKVCVGDWNPGWRDDWNSEWRPDWQRGPEVGLVRALFVVLGDREHPAAIRPS